jgi:hypothetical protein
MDVLGAGVLTIVALAALAGVVSGSLVAVIPLTAAVAGVVWLFRRDRRYNAGPTEQDVMRFQEIEALAKAPEFELKVAGASQLVPSLLLLAFGAGGLFMWADSKALIAALAALFFGSVGLVGLSAAIRSLGKPAITLSRSGFKTPLTPFVSWLLVDGIYLEPRRNPRTGSLVAHALIFCIPSLPRDIPRFALFYRLSQLLRRRSAKDRLEVLLRHTSEHPEIVYRAARSLWMQNTGKSHDWIPGMPPAINAALHSMGEARARLGDGLGTGKTPDPDKFRAYLEAIKERREAMSKELRRGPFALIPGLKLVVWLAAVSCSVLSLYFLVPVIWGILTHHTFSFGSPSRGLIALETEPALFWLNLGISALVSAITSYGAYRSIRALRAKQPS